jgi:phosphoribosylformylglycinamidine cyclo-ligase
MSGPEHGSAGGAAYREAGVDLAAAARVVGRIRDVAAGASRPEVVSGIGGFAGLVELGDGRLLAAATDGVGTKVEVARLAGRLDTVGIDLVAMSANDVVCTGADPLFFLDYLAVGRLVPDAVAAIVSGVAEGCRRAGCALLGGETAEHPGSMEEGQFDLAGFCVGVVREEDVLDPGAVQPGDVLVGLRSSGLHSNGYSLVRRALVDGSRPLREPMAELGGRTLAEELLEPTTIYVRPVLALSRDGLVRSAAHITGGGLVENIPRALRPGLAPVVDRSAWAPQPVFRLVADASGLSLGELFGVLNMGIGMVLVVPAGDGERAVEVAVEAGAEAAVIGRVEEGTGVRLVGSAPG